MEKNVYQILQDWHELLKNGAITETEFAAKKSELLGTGQKKENTNQNEELIRVLTPEEQAQSDAEYDLLFNNPNWFQKNKSWIIGVSIAVLTGFIIWYFINNEAKSSNNLDNSNSETLQLSQTEKLGANGSVIEDVGSSVLFAIYSGLSEKGEETNEIIAVPFVLYRNGNYEKPPTCEIGTTNQEAIEECEKAKEILLPSVQQGKRLYLLNNGTKDKAFTIIKSTKFGYSDWQTYSAQLSEKPKYSILTDNPKLGTNLLSIIQDKPNLQNRKDPEGNKLQDKILSKVDIDGDGIPELIYECSDYEGVFYQIYSKKNGKWTKVYEGGYQGV